MAAQRRYCDDGYIQLEMCAQVAELNELLRAFFSEIRQRTTSPEATSSVKTLEGGQ